MACNSPIIIENHKEYEYIPVPCGKCAECRKRKVDEWVFRMSEEDKVASSSHFVTLTYNTQCVPITPNGYMTLDKEDLQKFFKRLRKNTGYEKIKYYAVGEYGEKNQRPHYHAIVFNCPTAVSYSDAWSLTKKAWLKRYDPKLKNGRPYDPYPGLTDSDKIVLGDVHIGQTTGPSIAYTVKYLDKKRRTTKHSREDFAREFSVMSRGLGKNYISDETKKYHREHPDQLYLTMPGGKKIAMPKYYRNQIWPVDEMELERSEQLRSVHQAAMEKQKEDTKKAIKNGIPYSEYKRQKVDASEYKFHRYNSKTRRL